MHWMRVALFVFLLPACTSIQENMYRDYAVLPLVYDLDEGGYGKLIRGIRGKEREKVPEVCFNLTAAATPEVKEDCQQKSNMVISDLIAISDEMCQKHLQTIFGNDAAFNVTTGTLTNLFSGASALVGGLATSTKSLLSGLALFSNAQRSLVNEEVYKTMLVTAITKKIGETRKKQREAMIQSLKTGPDPIHIALLKVTEYHQTCSFMFGLQKALDEGTQARPDATATPIPTSTHPEP
jgi:hypothetical protein